MGGVGDSDCYDYYPDKEIYYLIGQEYWKNGYATEAMTALVGYCFNIMRLKKLIAFAKPENIVSNKIIQKLGFKFQHFVNGLPEKLDFYNGEPYYEALNKSSMLWHDGKNNLQIWLEYFLGVIIKAYKELEDRVGCIENTKGSKSIRIEMAIEGKLGYFTKNEIRIICPDVGEATINRVFERLKVDGKIEVVGKGRNSKWKKL